MEYDDDLEQYDFFDECLCCPCCGCTCDDDYDFDDYLLNYEDDDAENF